MGLPEMAGVTGKVVSIRGREFQISEITPFDLARAQKILRDRRRSERIADFREVGLNGVELMRAIRTLDAEQWILNDKRRVQFIADLKGAGIAGEDFGKALAKFQGEIEDPMTTAGGMEMLSLLIWIILQKASPEITEREAAELVGMNKDLIAEIKAAAGLGGGDETENPTMPQANP